MPLRYFYSQHAEGSIVAYNHTRVCRLWGPYQTETHNPHQGVFVIKTTSTNVGSLNGRLLDILGREVQAGLQVVRWQVKRERESKGSNCAITSDVLHLCRFSPNISRSLSWVMTDWKQGPTVLLFWCSIPSLVCVLATPIDVHDHNTNMATKLCLKPFSIAQSSCLLQEATWERIWPVRHPPPAGCFLVGYVWDLGNFCNTLHFSRMQKRDRRKSCTSLTRGMSNIRRTRSSKVPN